MNTTTTFIKKTSLGSIGVYRAVCRSIWDDDEILYHLLVAEFICLDKALAYARKHPDPIYRG